MYIIKLQKIKKKKKNMSKKQKKKKVETKKKIIVSDIKKNYTKKKISLIALFGFGFFFNRIIKPRSDLSLFSTSLVPIEAA